MSTLSVDQITDNSGGTTAQINGLTPTPSNMMGRNKIINGKMEIAQRGTSFAAIASGAYSLDRWIFGNTSAAVITASQQGDNPTAEFQNSLRLAVTTADTSIAAADLCRISQRIEGFNARDLIGRTFVLSFWARSSKTGTHCVHFSNSGGDRSYVAEYTISTANTWEYKTIPVSGGLISAGAWDWANGNGLSVNFTLAAGSNFHTTAGAWQTGNFLATANQVNCLDTVGNVFAITGVQLEVGSVATPFEHRPIGVELALCQRYCEVLYDPQYRTQIAGTTFALGHIDVSGVNSFVVTARIDFRATKRTAPTLINISENMGSAVHRWRVLSPDYYLVGAAGNNVAAALGATNITALSLAVAEL